MQDSCDWIHKESPTCERSQLPELGSSPTHVLLGRVHNITRRYTPCYLPRHICPLFLFLSHQRDEENEVVDHYYYVAGRANKARSSVDLLSVYAVLE